jgi:dolichol-phosphate mannosyltransferase
MSRIRLDRSQQPVPNTRLSIGTRITARDDRPDPTWIERLKKTAVEESSSATLSVVIPAKNEADSLPQLVEEVVKTLRALCKGPAGLELKRLVGFEVIIVNDGSTDETKRVLNTLGALYSELRSIHLSSTLGQSAALIIGFQAARGEWIATLDADLQNDPADLATLWHALGMATNVVLGWRVRREDVWSRRTTSFFANHIRNAILGQSIRDTGCSVRLMPRDVVLNLPRFQGMHRFFGPLCLRHGCHVVQVPVNHRPRIHGRSHYNVWNRSIGVIADLIGVAWLSRRAVPQTNSPAIRTTPIGSCSFQESAQEHGNPFAPRPLIDSGVMNQ